MKQVLMYMSHMSRTRERACLAQRGERREERQKSVAKNYVSEMGNNLWATKYPAFAKVSKLEQKAYWSAIFGAHKSMFAKASAQPETEDDEKRADQLVAQVRRST